jgi:hypothetical protein
MVVEGLPSIVGGMLGATAGGVESLTEISSATPSSFTWKLNSPKAMSKPPVAAETAPAVLEVGSMMIAAGVRSAALGDAVSMTADLAMSTSVSGEVVLTMVGIAMPTAMSMADSMSILAWVSSGEAESMAMVDVGPSNLGDAVMLSMVGEGAGESVDPDPVIPTVGTN